MLGALFGPAETWPDRDLVGLSREFNAEITIEAYRSGVFPMPIGAPGEMGWWSPVLRGVLPVKGVRVSRSLRQAARRYRTTIDTAFDEVLDGCADAKRPGGWIDQRIRMTFRNLHRAGWVHSVEVWAGQDLVGGLYGVHINGLFAGESMFHEQARGRDASKVALIRLAVELAGAGVELLDVQWLTEHLGSLGAYEVTRDEYLRQLDSALELPTRDWPDLGRLPGDELLSEWGRIHH